MSDPFRLGSWTVEPDLNRISGAAGSTRVEPKAMDVLVHLASRAGRVVSRQELVEAVWTGAFVTDDALRHAVSQLRGALDDEPRGSRFIETIPRRGYRLLVEPRPVEDARRTGGRPWHVRLRPWAGLGLIAAAAVALWSLPGACRDGRSLGRSIAVLPLRTDGGDAAERSLALGITDALINELARVGGFRKVISLQSVRQYESTAKSLHQIGAELGVEAVVEGSLQRSASRVSVTVRLVRVSSDAVVWAGQYDRTVRDLLTTQREVAAEVVRAVGVALGPDEQRRLATARPVDASALEAAAVGRDTLLRGTSRDVLKAVQLFTSAIDADPGWADAYAGRARAYLRLAVRPSGGVTRKEAVGCLREDLARALALAPDHAEARRLRAVLLSEFDWQWPDADREFRAALEAAPNRAEAHASYALFLLAMGRREEAAAEYARASDLDPLNAALQTNLARHLLMSGQLHESGAVVSAVLERLPDNVQALDLLAMLLVLQGRHQGAARLADRVLQLDPDSPPSVAGAGFVYARVGREVAARGVLRQLADMAGREYVAPEDFAWVHAALGDPDEAMVWLERAFADRSPELMLVRITPEYASLRADPRFQDLVRRMAFP